MSMEYRIERTDTANEQLRDIILYRADVTGDPGSALELLDLMEAEIRQLADFPEMGAPPRYAALRRRGFRVLIIEKYLAFYKIDKVKHLVTIYAIVDGRRDYLNLI